jgi:hypothetical protein
MSPTYEVTIEPLPQVSVETLRLLRESAPACEECALILKHVVAGDRLGPVWRPDGTQMTVEQVKRHVLEMKGYALSPKAVENLLKRAGTSRRPNGRGCFYCARILDALSEDGMLREWPADDKTEQVRIPIESQRAHLMVEAGLPAIWEEVNS